MTALAIVLALASALNTSPSFDYRTARKHEIKPHRLNIPHAGIQDGPFNQLRLTLTISPAGTVTDAKASGPLELLKWWPELQNEVRQWKFIPFERYGKPVTAEIEEYVNFVPPERLPKTRLPAPVVKPDSKVAILLQRTACYGSCPDYVLSLTTEGIIFNGRSHVVAYGKHTDRVDPANVRKLAQKFVSADFYSMDSAYINPVTDGTTCVLSITIDGATKQVTDYQGQRVGMPAIINELEEDVDTLAGVKRWTEGSIGLVQQLKLESLDFHSSLAQAMLQQSAERGQTKSVREFLQAGVPVKAAMQKVRQYWRPHEANRPRFSNPYAQHYVSQTCKLTIRERHSTRSTHLSVGRTCRRPDHGWSKYLLDGQVV